MKTFSDIPIVSLAAWRSGDDRARQQLADDVRRICHEVGFLTLVDHGIEGSFVDDWFAHLERLFALPDATKASIDKRHSPHFRGWESVGSELTDNKVDYREQVDLWSEHPAWPAGSTPAFLALEGPNQWLPEASLPGFRAAATEFFARMGTLAETLMELFAVGLGLAPSTFRDRFGERPMSLIKAISYPPTPPGSAGVNAHKDAGFLTLLHQHGVAGLQALNPDGEWIDVPPMPGAIVVNLGEMLQAMTGNYFVATTHRVITNEARLSSAYFHGPDLRTSLAPLQLEQRFVDAVEASDRHRGAGFMAKRHELLDGATGTSSAPAPLYGEQLWNYFVRSYPEVVQLHYPTSIVN